MHKRASTLGLSIGAILLTAAPPGASGSRPSGQVTDRLVIDTKKRSEIATTLGAFVKESKLVGVSALIYQNDREAFFGTYGYADRERRVPMSRKTIVRLFSVTKAVTAVALMELFDEGKFQLDDPVANYAPEFAGLKVYAGIDERGVPILKTPDRPPTIRDLMRQTAGFPAIFGGNPGDVDRRYAVAKPMDPQNTLADMARKLATVPLAAEPGERWMYSDSVDVQAYLVERLSGMPFDRFLRKRVFDPLRMVDTGYVVPSNKRDRLAVIYERRPDGAFAPASDRFNGLNLQETPMKGGGAGLVSTIDDFMQLVRMLANGGTLGGVRLLKPGTVELMFSDQLPPTVEDRSFLTSKGKFGYGLDGAVRIALPAESSEGAGEVGEYTWDGYTNTLFWIDPRNRIAAVLFTQYVPFGAVPLHKAFRDAVYKGTRAQALIVAASAMNYSH